MNTFEDFLNQGQNQVTTMSKVSKNPNAKTNTETEENSKYIYKAKGMLRAEKAASFEDFIEMVSKLVCLVMEDMNVEFLPDENQHVIIDPDMKTDKAYITYNLISRTTRREIKPMAREELVEKGLTESEDRYAMIYGQKYNCEVQFNIFASEYKTANKVMKTFEEMIFSFTGFMKSKGIENILFKGQQTDKNYDIFRKTMSVRNLKYHVETEDLLTIFNDKVESIILKGAL